MIRSQFPFALRLRTVRQRPRHLLWHWLVDLMFVLGWS